MNVVVQMAGADPLLNTAARNASNIHDLSVSMKFEICYLTLKIAKLELKHFVYTLKSNNGTF